MILIIFDGNGDIYLFNLCYHMMKIKYGVFVWKCCKLLRSLLFCFILSFILVCESYKSQTCSIYSGTFPLHLELLKYDALLLTGTQEISMDWMMNNLHRKESELVNCPCRICLLTNVESWRFSDTLLLSFSFLYLPNTLTFTSTCF